jgi:hypothetical protein
MKTRRLFLLSFASAYIFLFVFVGCDKEDSYYSGNLIVYNYINPGCTNKTSSGYSENKEQETIHLKYINDGSRLEVVHLNARHGSSGKISVEASLDNMNITINEKDNTTSTEDRNYTYDLSYELPLKEFGSYTITINNSKTHKFDFNCNTNTVISD